MKCFKVHVMHLKCIALDSGSIFPDLASKNSSWPENVDRYADTSVDLRFGQSERMQSTDARAEHAQRTRSHTWCL